MTRPSAAEVRTFAAWLLLVGTLLPLPLYWTGASSGDDTGAPPIVAAPDGLVLVGSLLIIGLCVTALSRRPHPWARAAASALAWGLVWLNPLVFLLLTRAPAVGVVVAGSLAAAGITISLLSARRAVPEGRRTG